MLGGRWRKKTPDSFGRGAPVGTVELPHKVRRRFLDAGLVLWPRQLEHGPSRATAGEEGPPMGSWQIRVPEWQLERVDGVV